MPYSALNADQRGGTGPNGKHSLTVAEAAAQLGREGLSWTSALGQAANVTYAYRATAPAVMPDDAGGFMQFNAQQIAATERALALWSKMANITFTRVGSGTSGDAAYSNDATILFSDYTTGVDDAAAFAFLPGSRAASSAAGDVWINSSIGYNRSPGAQSTPGFLTLLHEIGHSIGLSHPGDYDGDDNVTYANSAGYYEDSLEYTVMSYFDLEDTGGATNRTAYPGGPLIDDIAAAQRLYGANLNANSSDTLYGASAYSPVGGPALGDDYLTGGYGNPIYGTIWDGGGTDSLVFTNSSFAVKLDLRPGSFSDVQGGVGTLSIALGTIIENAYGGYADDTLVGNDAANILDGGGGNDSLTGGRGDDLLIGNEGNDRAIFALTFASATLSSAGSDVIVVSADGRDTLRTIETVRFADRDIATSNVLATDSLYTVYLGRPTAGGEMGFWLSQIGIGRSLTDVRAAILADPSGQAHTQIAVDGLYQTYFLRSASSNELSFWDGQVRAGSDFDAVRRALIADPAGQAVASIKIDATYQDLLGRHGSTEELAFWVGQFRSGSDYPQIRAAIARDYSASQAIDNRIAYAYYEALARSASSSEISFWHGEIARGTSFDQFRSVLYADPASSPITRRVVAQFYTDYLGRAASSAELAFWDGQVHAGTPREMVRHAIANDPGATSAIAAKIDHLYTDFMGRPATASEIGYWTGYVRDDTHFTRYDAGFYAVQVAIVSDPVGRAYSSSVVNGLYQSYFARPAAQSELDSWNAFFRSDTRWTYTAVADALISDRGSDATGTHRIFMQPGAETVDLGSDIGRTVIRYFNPVEDTLDLRNAHYSGINPLDAAHAQEVVSTEISGALDVLITFDQSHILLLKNLTLAQLSSSDFLLG